MSVLGSFGAQNVSSQQQQQQPAADQPPNSVNNQTNTSTTTTSSTSGGNAANQQQGQLPRSTSRISQLFVPIPMNRTRRVIFRRTPG